MLITCSKLLFLYLQPYQPLQSPGYQSPEVRVWNRLIADGTADRSNSVSMNSNLSIY